MLQLISFDASVIIKIIFMSEMVGKTNTLAYLYTS
jgi:hypothetical protein